MANSIPSSEDLRRLTLRALAAYAAKCARLSAEALRGEISDKVIEAPIDIAERFASVAEINRVDAVTICYAAAGVSNAMSTLASEKYKAALCLVALERVVSGVHEAARSGLPPSKWVQTQYDRAIEGTMKIAQWVLQYSKSNHDTIRHQYEMLLREYGAHEQITLGTTVVL